MEALIGLTYRCNARCQMCHTWKFPTSKGEEISAGDIAKIPDGLSFVNITGGEPFLRDDIADVIRVVKKKASRIVISTNGFLTDRTIAIARENPDIGIRISIEGLPKTNDELRGLKDGFDRGIRTLIELRRMGLKDIGFGITVSDANAHDLLPLYELSKALKMEFATAVVHNSYYFHKMDNRIDKVDHVAGEFEKLVGELLRTNRIKNWYRAYFNHGIVNYIRGGKRLLPCSMGTDVFYLDPFGEVRPCNAMEESMGNIKEKSFDEIWNGEEARRVREMVANCDKNCWMIGSVAPAMKRHLAKPTLWILRNIWKYRFARESA